MRKFLLAALAFMTFASATSQNNNVVIEDATFKAYLVKNFDKNGDGEILRAEAAAVTEICITGIGTAGITSLKGVEAFVNLTELSCYDNRLTSLDVSKNTKLTELRCFCNRLTSLDVSKNTKLLILDCDENPNLTELFLATGQSLAGLSKDSHTVIKYK